MSIGPFCYPLFFTHVGYLYLLSLFFPLNDFAKGLSILGFQKTKFGFDDLLLCKGSLFHPALILMMSFNLFSLN